VDFDGVTGAEVRDVTAKACCIDEI